jgi:sugar phosphate isomerase/epimerase
MPALKDLEVGAMFWAGKDPRETLREVKALGVSCGQLGVPGDMPLEGVAEAWKEALQQEDFTVVTVFCAYVGESYADIPTVEQTVGFIPQATRAEREQRTKDVSHFAAQVGVKSIACHVGFVPEDKKHPDYIAVRDLVRRICDHAAHHGQTFAMETGQEPADVLLEFLHDVDRQNLGINFDPANLIMYGSGDPIQAVEVLHEHLLSVHAKDGVWPPQLS